MRKPRIPISARKKKVVKRGNNKQETQVEDNEEVYGDIQHLQSGECRV